MPLFETSIRNIKAKSKPQKLSDGGGLFLYVTIAGSKRWRMAYRFGGKQKLLSFGPYPTIGLKEARKLREEAKELLFKGIDPSAARKETKAEAALGESKLAETFKSVANEWFVRYSPRLTPKHAEKLRLYLERRLFPVLGDTPVSAIEPMNLLTAVRPVEEKGNIETAHKLMQLCGQIMRYAKITGRVKYDVASGLTEALMTVPVKHFAAVTAPKEIGHLLRDIDGYQGHFAVMFFLKILPYVFTRPSELRLAQWSEVDFGTNALHIPAQRMKMRREHVVPLAPQVIDLLRELRVYAADSNFLFPGACTSTVPISDMAPLAALRRLGYAKDRMTLHGFRAMASTNLNELGFRPDVIEAQLAHKEPDAVRLAYNRAQYLEERRKMMQAWADYLDGLKSSGADSKEQNFDQKEPKMF